MNGRFISAKKNTPLAAKHQTSKLTANNELQVCVKEN